MKIHYEDDRVHVWEGDCIKVLASLPSASVDAVICDPPYGLANTTPAQVAETLLRWVNGERDYLPSARGFMGKEWDGFVPPVAVWDECLRVLKPGGHVLVFAGSRTVDLMTLGLRLAGFDIRDSIAWLYGSGFSKGGLLGNKPGLTWCECSGNALPLSHASNLEMRSLREGFHPPAIPCGESQDADLLATMQREVARAGVGKARAQGPGGVEARNGSASSRVHARGEEPSVEGRQLHRAGQGLSDDPQAGSPAGEIEWLCGRTPAGHGGHDWAPGDAARRGASPQRTAGGQSPGEPEAVPGSHDALDDRALRDGAVCPRCGGLPPAFRGFSTTLKPGHEPIVVARKPFPGTVASNVLEHGTGALNIDGCRIGDGERINAPAANKPGGASLHMSAVGMPQDVEARSVTGRWPANVVLDETQAEALDEMSGDRKSSGVYPGDGSRNGGDWATNFNGDHRPSSMFNDQGGASRFFYTAKADSNERPRIPRRVLRLRDDLTPEQADHVRARLIEAGVKVD